MSRQMDADDVLIKAFVNGDPVVLFLGQDAWHNGSEEDSVLVVAKKHLGLSPDVKDGWMGILKAMPLPDEFFLWLDERYRRKIVPTWLSILVELPWSALFTSNFDSTLSHQLRGEARVPQPVLTADEIPPALRSKSRTPIYYLFGRAGSADQHASAPQTKSQFRVRKAQHTIPMVNRIVDATTAIGLLVIDGYCPSRDWLDTETLLAVIERLPDRRIVWFGWDENNSNIPEEVRELADSGRIQIEPLRLGAYLAGLDASGRLDDLEIRRSSEAGAITYRGGKRSVITPELRIQVEAASHVVDDQWSEFLEPLGLDAEYAAFVRFHGNIDGSRALVEGIRRNFAIVREFESLLWKLIKDGCDNHAKLNDPVIVHGQSATGKSIALAHLVSRLRGDMDAAVLYATSRIPQPSEVTSFCECVERDGAQVTVLVCDCNAPVHRYRDLLQGLRSRGRRVIVVGTSYRIVDNDRPLPKEFIEAPIVLSLKESSSLLELTTRFTRDGAIQNVVSSDNILATLYRILPSSRYHLSSGLGGEARNAEDMVRTREKDVALKPLSQIAQQFLALGLATDNTTVLENSLLKAIEDGDDLAAKLVDLVMAAGQLNCPIPINLLIRTVTSNTCSVNLSKIAAIFKGLDLFRWRASGSRDEDLLVSPRVTLEAELLCRRRLMTADAEAKKLLELIRSVRVSWDIADSERRFLVDLVQKLGPDGPLRTRYRDNYVEIARALTSLRTETGIDDPRLSLQESVLRRSAIRENAVPSNETVVLLEEARNAVQSSIDHLLAKRSRAVNSRVHSNLVVELSTIYGFLAVHEARNHAGPAKIWSAYRAARAASQTAIGITDAYNPLDVALWTPTNLLREGGLDEVSKLELHADVRSILDRVDSDALPVDQRERFNTRLHTLGGLLDMPEMSEQALRTLDDAGSAAGYFLRAQQLGPTRPNHGESLADRKKADEAADFLENNWSRLVRDERCLRYLITCHWIADTGQWPLRGERKSIPPTEARRNAILKSLRALRDLGALERDQNLLFVEIVLLWLGPDESQALRLWRDLERDTEFLDSRRVIKRLILTDEKGRPRVFEGRVESETNPGRFTVRVDSLGRCIQVLERDFPRHDLAYGRTISRFGIAFNYIGPIADPLHHDGGKP